MSRAHILKQVAHFMSPADVINLSMTSADARVLASEEECERFAREFTGGNVGARLSWMTWRAFLFALHERAILAPNHQLDRALVTVVTTPHMITARAAYEWISSPKFCNDLTRWVWSRDTFQCMRLVRDDAGRIVMRLWKSRVRMLLRGDVIWITPRMTDEETSVFRAMCESNSAINAMFIWDGDRVMRCEYFVIPPLFAPPLGEFSDEYFAGTGAVGTYTVQNTSDTDYIVKLVGLRFRD